MKHLIHRQILDVRFADGKASFQRQQQLSDWFRYQLKPVIERVFNDFGAKGEHLHISDLEIDLGRISEGRLAHPAMARLFEEQLRRALREKMLHGKADEVQRRTQSEHLFEHWLRRLRTGVVAWDSPRALFQDKQEVLQWLSQAASRRTALRDALQDESVCLRLEQEYPGATLFELGAIVWQQTGLARDADLLIELEQIIAAQKPSVKPLDVHLHLRRTWLSILVKTPKVTTLQQAPARMASLLQVTLTTDVLVGALQLLTEKTDTNQKYWEAVADHLPLVTKKQQQQNLRNKTEDGDIIPPVDSTLSSAKKGQLSTKSQQTTEEQPGRKNRPSTADDETNTTISETLEGEESKPAATQEEWDTPDMPDAIYIAQAGIVLLHPFLSTFFSKLDLVTKGQFRDQAAQERAALLLAYLATGTTDWPGVELTLHKFLSGLALNHPLSQQWSITEEEKNTAEELLQAVVQHWGALGDVSNESLRQGFLQRDGKLSTNSGRWLLQPEQQTIDILLQKLPWGMSMIKLPWTKELLIVEWT